MTLHSVLSLLAMALWWTLRLALLPMAMALESALRSGLPLLVKASLVDASKGGESCQMTPSR